MLEREVLELQMLGLLTLDQSFKDRKNGIERGSIFVRVQSVEYFAFGLIQEPLSRGFDEGLPNILDVPSAAYRGPFHLLAGLLVDQVVPARCPAGTQQQSSRHRSVIIMS